MQVLQHHWHGLSCCEFVVATPLEPALFRSLGLAAERLRAISVADGVVSSYQSVGIYWRRPPASPQRAVEQVETILRESLAMDAASLEHTGKTHEVQACYDGPDLGDVAEHCGISITEVKRRHIESEYIVAAVGFMPHFAYLWGMDASLATPRKASPRPRVPLGSIGIANDQTGIYPCESPGGWQLIGQVEESLCREICCQLKIGDVVRFVDSGAKSQC